MRSNETNVPINSGLVYQDTIQTTTRKRSFARREKS